MYNIEFEKKFNEVFAKNLRYYMDLNRISQNELSKELNVSPTSVNNWCNGYKTPRMDRVDEICRFFHINRSDLMNDHSSEPDVTGITNLLTPASRPIPILGDICAGEGT
nr:MAG TPA: Repressor protein CI [Caudoviricetes sp.]